ncbi:MAG: hypothetical protein JWQ09_5858 [Segetibacter sp.]|nr:hypothetical protein [Segetibacter sp.]
MDITEPTKPYVIFNSVLKGIEIPGRVKIGVGLVAYVHVFTLLPGISAFYT